MNLWLIITLSTGLVGYFAIWSRTKSKARWFAILAFVVAAPVSGFAMFQSLGWPVPIVKHLSSLPEGDYVVMGAKMIPDVAMYLMLDIGEDAPRLFELPWDPKKASDLQRKMEGEGKIKARFKGPDSTMPDFFTPPPEATPPPKPEAAQGFTYERQEP